MIFFTILVPSFFTVNTFLISFYVNSCKAVNCFSNVARVKYLTVTSHLHLHRHLLLFYIRLGSHFCQQIKHIPLKKMMMIRTTCKAVNCFSNVARVKYLIVTSHLHLHRHLLLFYIRLGSHFCQQIKHIPLKKMMIRTTCKAVNRPFYSCVLSCQAFDLE